MARYIAYSLHTTVLRACCTHTRHLLAAHILIACVVCGVSSCSLVAHILATYLLHTSLSLACCTHPHCLLVAHILFARSLHTSSSLARCTHTRCQGLLVTHILVVGPLQTSSLLAWCLLVADILVADLVHTFAFIAGCQCCLLVTHILVARALHTSSSRVLLHASALVACCTHPCYLPVAHALVVYSLHTSSLLACCAHPVTYLLHASCRTRPPYLPVAHILITCFSRTPLLLAGCPHPLCSFVAHIFVTCLLHTYSLLACCAHPHHVFCYTHPRCLLVAHILATCLLHILVAYSLHTSSLLAYCTHICCPLVAHILCVLCVLCVGGSFSVVSALVEGTSGPCCTRVTKHDWWIASSLLLACFTQPRRLPLHAHLSPGSASPRAPHPFIAHHRPQPHCTVIHSTVFLLKSVRRLAKPLVQSNRLATRGHAHTTTLALWARIWDLSSDQGSPRAHCPLWFVARTPSWHHYPPSSRLKPETDRLAWPPPNRYYITIMALCPGAGTTYG
jgi:hypothetical protein